jgi:hypothetical protein
MKTPIAGLIMTTKNLTFITDAGGLSPLLCVQIVHFVEGSDCLELVSWFMMEGKL